MVSINRLYKFTSAPSDAIIADPPLPQIGVMAAEDSDMVTIDGLYELTNALSNGTIVDPLRTPLLPK